MTQIQIMFAGRGMSPVCDLEDKLDTIKNGEIIRVAIKQV